MITDGLDIFGFKLDRMPTHPGKILKDYLEDLEITQSQFAHNIDVSFQAINEIINGKRGISPEMSIRLAKYLNTSVELWLGLQNQYDIYKILNDEKKTKSFNKIVSIEQHAV